MDTARNQENQQQMDLSIDSISDSNEIYENAITQARKIHWAPVMSKKNECFLVLDDFRLEKASTDVEGELDEQNRLTNTVADNQPSQSNQAKVCFEL